MPPAKPGRVLCHLVLAHRPDVITVSNGLATDDPVLLSNGLGNGGETGLEAFLPGSEVAGAEDAGQGATHDQEAMVGRAPLRSSPPAVAVLINDVQMVDHVALPDMQPPGQLAGRRAIRGWHTSPIVR